MKNLKAMLAVALVAWAYHPASFAEETTNPDVNEALFLKGEGHGGGDHGGGNHGGGDHGGGHHGGGDHDGGHHGGGDHDGGHHGGGDHDGDHDGHHHHHHGDHGGDHEGGPHYCWSGGVYPWCHNPGWNPPAPPPHYADLCDGNFRGTFDGYRANFSLNTRGESALGSIFIGNRRLSVSGVCRQVGRQAAFVFHVGGSPLAVRGRIVESGGSITLNGYQDQTGKLLRMWR